MAKRIYCGFCGKADDEVDRLLAGPCIEVCNECIDLMHQIIHAPKPILPVKLATEKPRKVIPFADLRRQVEERRKAEKH